jgi:hypothetical protein
MKSIARRNCQGARLPLWRALSGSLALVTRTNVGERLQHPPVGHEREHAEIRPAWSSYQPSLH